MCPTENHGKEIGTICLDNNRTRLIVDSFQGLINISVPNNERAQQWKYCVTDHYSPAIRILRKKEDLSEAEIRTFQEHVDLFFQSWVDLVGSDGITNYIHLLASGHIAEYVRYWKSLYPHSQQGWEALNSLIKTFYFHRTNRGGKPGGRRGNGRKSRVLGIGRWLLRRMVWAMGWTYEDMKEDLAEDGYEVEDW
jgi:hypothetical protein